MIVTLHEGFPEPAQDKVHARIGDVLDGKVDYSIQLGDVGWILITDRGDTSDGKLAIHSFITDNNTWMVEEVAHKYAAISFDELGYDLCVAHLPKEGITDIAKESMRIYNQNWGSKISHHKDGYEIRWTKAWFEEAMNNGNT